MAKLTPTDEQTPAAQGYRMPGEWEPHEATWLCWPQNPDDWPDKIDTIRWAFTEIILKITRGEKVRLLVADANEQKRAQSYLTRAKVDLRKVQFLYYPTNRGWMRDCGPIFVRRESRAKHSTRSETAIVHFHFNAWAKYNNWQKDRRVPEMAAELFKKQLFNAEHQGHDFVIEGGGIELNGRGTLITTEECYLDPKVQVRNPGLGRKEIESVLGRYLGATNVQWLAAGPVGDDTHGHIDDICRFVDRRTLVLVREENSKDANYRALAENWERVPDLRLEDGSKPRVVALPMPHPVRFEDCRLPASYANFYICNAAVLVPTFNDPNDRIALGILGELFKDRPVIGIHAVDLVWGFGTLHCLSQQQPL